MMPFTPPVPESLGEAPRRPRRSGSAVAFATRFISGHGAEARWCRRPDARADVYHEYDVQ
jgi:hypothetical protein